MRYVELKDVQPGNVVGLPVYNNNGRLLINTGAILNAKNIKKLKELNISAISIEDKISEGIDVSDNISQKIKNKTVKHLKTLNIDKIEKDAAKIVNEIIDCNELYEYFNIKTFENFTYEHSLSVATYSAMMGYACGFDISEIKDLTLAGLLHDIGKYAIDKAIIEKNGKLTEKEYTEIKKHPAFGYNMVQSNYNLKSTVKVSILEHHENEDGSGYPRHLTGKNIYKFAKIIHIADVYDAIISKRPYKDKASSKEAINYIISQTGTMFDETYVNTFIQIIPAFPRGSIVKLNDGREAIVLRNDKSHIEQPDIRIIETSELIKLSKEDNLTIDEIIQR